MDTKSSQTVTVTALSQEQQEVYFFEAKKRILALDEERARSEAAKARMDMERAEIELANARGGNPAEGNKQAGGIIVVVIIIVIIVINKI